MSISHEAPRVKLTYADYVLFPDDGNRHELINGRHYMNPAPSPRHQKISRLLQHQLITQIELEDFGEVYDAPTDLQLTESDIVQPDLIVVSSDNAIVTSTKIEGRPDLVVEILSPGTRKNDEQLKRQLYAQSGIPEYWLVDPETNSIYRLVLNDTGNAYADSEVLRDEIRYSFPGGEAVVDLAKVW